MSYFFILRSTSYGCRIKLCRFARKYLLDIFIRDYDKFKSIKGQSFYPDKENRDINS